MFRNAPDLEGASSLQSFSQNKQPAFETLALPAATHLAYWWLGLGGHSTVRSGRKAGVCCLLPSVPKQEAVRGSRDT